MSHPDEPCSGWRRHWRRWALAGVLLAGAVFHAWLLRGLARTLIADDGVQAADHVLVLGGERSFDSASQLYRGGPAARFHYIEPPASRLVSMGIKPSWGVQCVRQLTRRGVPAEAISPIGGTADDAWGVARRLRAWLQEHPDDKVLVLCGRFNSGATRFAMSSVMDAAELDRIAIWCPSDPRFDETNWWKSHDGRRELVVAFFTQAYFRLHGEDADPPPLFDPDAYERGLK